jgi:hypothetical protein
VPLQSLEYVASGRYYQFGQAPAPELPWPEFMVDGYVATLDFERNAVHTKYHRVQVQEAGRERPHSEQTMDQYAREGVTWNLTPGPVAMPANLVERGAELWGSPQGFVSAALENHPTIELHKDGSARVSFVGGKQRFEGELNRDGDVTRFSTIMDSPVLGDTPIEFRYSNYRDFNGIRFPGSIERSVAGLPWYQLTVSEVRLNRRNRSTFPRKSRRTPIRRWRESPPPSWHPACWCRRRHSQQRDRGATRGHRGHRGAAQRRTLGGHSPGNPPTLR